MKTKPQPSFWVLSSMGRADEGPDKERLDFDDQIDVLSEAAITIGRPVDNWKPPRVRAGRASPLEDMPWNNSLAPIVSERLKSLLERHVPGHAEFLPCHPTYRGKALPTAYWYVNWLNVVECADLTRSTYAHEPNTRANTYNEGYDFTHLVIDEHRASPDVHVFRVRFSMQTTLIRSGLRALFDAAGITGCQYYTVDLGDTPRE